MRLARAERQLRRVAEHGRQPHLDVGQASPSAGDVAAEAAAGVGDLELQLLAFEAGADIGRGRRRAAVSGRA